MSEQFSGRVDVLDPQGRAVFQFDSTFALLDIGAQGNEGDLRLFGDDGSIKIHLDAGTGDITLTGADCAEDFETEAPEPPEAGSVMTIGDAGRLRPCTEPYDKRAAGVISGAGSLRSAIVLDRHPGRVRRSPLALSGKVFCKVDAGYSPIEVGDLLTTSPTLGHAMKATDGTRAFGATIGKALRPLSSGTALVPILVALQ